MFHFMDWGGMWFGGFFWIGLIALVVWLIVRNNSSRANYPPNFGESPLDILKRRYAKGEISKDDFDRMKKDLEN